MGKKFDKLKTELLELADRLDRDRRIAEEVMEGVNEAIVRLTEIGYAPEMVIVGEAIYRRPYAPPEDAIRPLGQIVRAAVLVPEGFGVMAWDAEIYQGAELTEPEASDEALGHFTPFERCDPALKALLLPHLVPLLRAFRARLPIPLGAKPDDDNGLATPQE